MVEEITNINPFDMYYYNEFILSRLFFLQIWGFEGSITHTAIHPFLFNTSILSQK